MRRPARSAKVRPDRRQQRVAVAARPRAPIADLTGVLQAAVSHHQAGNASEAERLYRQVLAVDPEQADALHLLGVLAYQAGRADLAAPLIQRAIEHRPSAPSYHLNLGNALLALGCGADAVASYRQATALAPADPEAYY